MLREETITYQCEGKDFRGFLVQDPDVQGLRPAVLVAPAWRGLDLFAKQKAKELAELGYIGFAADLYGQGIHVDTNEKAQELMAPLFLDRQTLRDRIVAAYQTVANLKGVDKTRMGAIGFCFGGMTVIELLRSGVLLKGVVSFHGLLGDHLREMTARRAPSASKLNGAILILHGHDDPLVSQEDITQLQEELTAAHVDWQMNIYGHTKHAFTNPEAHEKELGLLYNPITCRRALASMHRFFEEVFIT